MNTEQIRTKIKELEALLDEQELKTFWFKGFEYKEVKSKTGKIWLDRNLGAKRVAQSADDELSYGSYHSFDEVECPAGYRLPTEEEWETERNRWVSNDADGAFNSPLKLPLAGIRNYSSGSLLLVGSIGHYWSSTVSGSLARLLFFYSGNAIMVSYYRALGFSVRCIKD